VYHLRSATEWSVGNSSATTTSHASLGQVQTLVILDYSARTGGRILNALPIWFDSISSRLKDVVGVKRRAPVICRVFVVEQLSVEQRSTEQQKDTAIA
jgi:hypothetical protein